MKHNKLILSFTFIVYLFLLGPLFIIVAASFGKAARLQFPPQQLSLHWFQNVFAVQAFMSALWVSVIIALGATAIALVLGIPATYAMSRFRFPGKAAFNALFSSPVLIPGIVLGMMLLKLIVLRLHTPILISLLIGHIILVLPYIIRVVTASLSNFDYSVEEAAMNLGAGRVRTFVTIVLPNIRAGVLSACILSVVNSFNNVPMSVFLNGPGVNTLPIEMLSYVMDHFDPTIAALSAMLMGVTVALMFLVEKTLGLRSIA